MRKQVFISCASSRSEETAARRELAKCPVPETSVRPASSRINGLNEARPHRLLTAATATKHGDDDDDDEDDWDDEDGDEDGDGDDNDNADDDDDDDDDGGRAEGDHGHCIRQL